MVCCMVHDVWGQLLDYTLVLFKSNPNESLFDVSGWMSRVQRRVGGGYQCIAVGWMVSGNKFRFCFHMVCKEAVRLRTPARRPWALCRKNSSGGVKRPRFHPQPPFKKGEAETRSWMKVAFLVFGAATKCAMCSVACYFLTGYKSSFVVRCISCVLRDVTQL